MPRRTAPAPRLPEVAVESDFGFLAGTYVDHADAGTTAMLPSQVLDVASAMNVVATGDGVFVNDAGPFRHTGGGVLEMNGQDAKWLFTRTEHEVILQKSDALAAEDVRQEPWHWDARATILPLSLPILLAVPAFVFGWVQRRWRPGRNLGYLLAFSGLAALLGVYLELQYYPANYFEEGPTLALRGWRLMLNLSWLAAIAALYPGHESAAVARLPRNRVVRKVPLRRAIGLSAVTLVVLVPYWGLVGICI